MTSLVEADRLSKSFAVRRGVLRRLVGTVDAVDGVSLSVGRGECLALVGESGSGKTTLGRCLLRLMEPSGGRVRFRGEDLMELSPARLRRRRRSFQMIFQDPYGSLNPRMRVGRILAEPLEVHRTVPPGGRAARVRELLEMVGLPRDSAKRYPHEFSGGQRQRIGIARALAPEPEFLVADEPVSALDVSVRGQIINLLGDLRGRLGLSMLFIAHDLAVVEQIADRVAVMYFGRLVEEAPTEALFRYPLHPYTVSLLSAIPRPVVRRKRERIVLAGDPPSPMSPPSGCRFHPRCPIATAECSRQEPELVEIGAGHRVACHLPGELDRTGRQRRPMELSSGANVGHGNGGPAA